MTYTIRCSFSLDKVTVHSTRCVMVGGDSVGQREFTTVELALDAAHAIGLREVVACGCTRHEALGV